MDGGTSRCNISFDFLCINLCLSENVLDKYNLKILHDKQMYFAALCSTLVWNLHTQTVTWCGIWAYPPAKSILINADLSVDMSIHPFFSPTRLINEDQCDVVFTSWEDFVRKYLYSGGTDIRTLHLDHRDDGEWRSITTISLNGFKFPVLEFLWSLWKQQHLFLSLTWCVYTSPLKVRHYVSKLFK